MLRVPDQEGAEGRSNQEGFNCPNEPFKACTRPGSRPHIRRAHMHSRWTGPRKDRKKQEIVTRWLPPIPVKVGLEGEELVPTIRPVKGPIGS
jgi:hypothetical protein